MWQVLGTNEYQGSFRIGADDQLMAQQLTLAGEIQSLDRIQKTHYSWGCSLLLAAYEYCLMRPTAFFLHPGEFRPRLCVPNDPVR